MTARTPNPDSRHRQRLEDPHFQQLRARVKTLRHERTLWRNEALRQRARAELWRMRALRKGQS
jgi:hypothetical protein